MSNQVHHHIDYLSKQQKKDNVSNNSKNLKFATFLPNAKVAENPFPKSPVLLLVNDINIWFPVDNIVEGRIFPVKTSMPLSLPP